MPVVTPGHLNGSSCSEPESCQLSSLDYGKTAVHSLLLVLHQHRCPCLYPVIAELNPPPPIQIAPHYK